MKDTVAISQSVCMVDCHVVVDLSVCKPDAIAVVDACTDIGNGLPLGVVVTTPEIAQVLTQRILIAVILQVGFEWHSSSKPCGRIVLTCPVIRDLSLLLLFL